MSEPTCEAVFENGVFRPLERLPVALIEGQLVRLVVELEQPQTDALSLIGQVYQGLSEEEISEIERIALNRRHCN